MKSVIYKGYRVFEDGTIIGKRGHKLKYGINTQGYYDVVLYDEGKRIQMFVHTVIWEAFNGSKPINIQIDHKDDNKTNNSLDNLQLLSNRNNSIKRNKKPKSGYTGVYWLNNKNKWCAKIYHNNKQVYIKSDNDPKICYDAYLYYKETYNLM